ncbi:hypothetical protein HYQ46_013361 [Verticillium longisporum]|nr:hypothetical protein HYQ46_013361 [Verticillium longisporum]
MSDSRFSEQVTWELDMQETADLVVVLFHHSTAAPISLLEFGLAARSGKVIAACLESGSKSYENKGNVQAVCARFQIQLLETQEDLHAAVRYENKGNVQAVCARFQIQLLETQEDLHAAVVKFLAE